MISLSIILIIDPFFIFLCKTMFICLIRYRLIRESGITLIVTYVV